MEHQFHIISLANLILRYHPLFRKLIFIYEVFSEDYNIFFNKVSVNFLAVDTWNILPNAHMLFLRSVGRSHLSLCNYAYWYIDINIETLGEWNAVTCLRNEIMWMSIHWSTILLRAYKRTRVSRYEINYVCPTIYGIWLFSNSL